MVSRLPGRDPPSDPGRNLPPTRGTRGRCQGEVGEEQKGPGGLDIRGPTISYPSLEGSGGLQGPSVEVGSRNNSGLGRTVVRLRGVPASGTRTDMRHVNGNVGPTRWD